MEIILYIVVAKNGLEYTSQDMAGIKEIYSNSPVRTFDKLTEGIAHEKQERFTEGAWGTCGNQLVGLF